MSRRAFLKYGLIGAAQLLLNPLAAFPGSKKKSPNVLFLAIDDLNDWVGALGGHPDAATPNIDRLGNQGVVFSKAYAAAPACCPSRTSIMTGLLPSTLGVYSNNESPWQNHAVERGNSYVTLPECFLRNGYQVHGAGKLFHSFGPSKSRYWTSYRSRGNDPKPDPAAFDHDISKFRWGPLAVDKADMEDWKISEWASSMINSLSDTPFFLGVGLYKPHLPWHVPQKYFDAFPLESINLPTTMPDDVRDLPPIARNLIRKNEHCSIVEHGLWKSAVQAYLASSMFVDDCVGNIIDALERSRFKDNTIVVLWGDHGWSLGEKKHWHKFALWENTTRTPLIISLPGENKTTFRYADPVSLLDIYPTLIDLCDLKGCQKGEGDSLATILHEPASSRKVPAISVNGPGNFSVRFEKWHFIQYRDGSIELYDISTDPHEWFNIASDNKGIVRRLAEFIPTTWVDERSYFQQVTLQVKTMMHHFLRFGRFK